MISLSSPMRRHRGLTAGAFVLLTGALGEAKPVPASEQIDRSEPLPERLRGIDVRERLGSAAAAAVPFTDEAGRPARLADFLDGQHPVILTLNYSKCPMLCSLELNGLVTALQQVDWIPGDQFEIVTVVLDPSEKPEEAAKSKARYMRRYGKPSAASGWHFLTGSDASIRAVADSVGFHYGWNEKRNEYVHPAAIVLLSPKGTISRYLYGIEYDPKTLRLSLAEVADGKVRSSLDQLILFCFHYDEKEGRYAPAAMNIMRAASGFGATVLGGFLASYWLGEHRKRKQSPEPSAEGATGSSPS